MIINYYLHKIKLSIKFLFNISLLGMFLFFNNACKKIEGKGGQATIRGILFSKSVFNTNSISRPEIDEDVFIVYGNGSTQSDKVSTSGDGSFEFKFLQPGTYRLFAFGLDTSNPKAANTIAYYKEVTINSRKEVVNVSNFIVYKKINDGTNRIFGKLISKNAFNAGTNNNDYLPLANEDVFIIYGNGTQYDDRARTSADGSFEFNSLRDGNYRIYAYSVDTSGSIPTGTIPIYKDVILSGNNNNLNTGNLLVYQIDGGTNKITGKLISRNVYNAGTLFNDSIPEANEDIFIVYGNGTQYYDKTNTNADGSFEFTNLRSGNYRIFAYSLDTTGLLPSGNLPIYKNVQLSGSNLIKDIGKLVVYQDADKNGTSSITGRIFARHFNATFTQFQYQGPEPDWDVYIKYGNGTFGYDERVKTDAAGRYQFPNLRQGIYSVYALSDTILTVNGVTTTAVKKLKLGTISATNSTVNLADINISRN
jgi:hypothetical protein